MPAARAGHTRAVVLLCYCTGALHAPAPESFRPRHGAYFTAKGNRQALVDKRLGGLNLDLVALPGIEPGF